MIQGRLVELHVVQTPRNQQLLVIVLLTEHLVCLKLCSAQQLSHTNMYVFVQLYQLVHATVTSQSNVRDEHDN